MTGQTRTISHQLSSKFEPVQSQWELMRVGGQTLARVATLTNSTLINSQQLSSSSGQILTVFYSYNPDKTSLEGDNTKKDTTQDSDSGEASDVESDGADQPKMKTSKQDVSSKPSTRRRRKRIKYKRKQQLNSVKVKPGDRVCVEIIKTKTKADVMWQDGRLEKNVDTLDLFAIYHIDDHQFLPGYIVNDKRGEMNTNPKLNSVIYFS